MEKTKKPVAFALALVLVVALAVAGTIAWLTARSGEVVNTFTAGNIAIELTEDGATEGDDGNFTRGYKMVPGNTLDKKPEVTVKAGSEACYLFVQIEESIGASVEVDGESLTFDDFITYGVIDGDDGWTQLDSVPGVYYREVGATASDTPFSVIKSSEAEGAELNKVTVKDAVTKQMMDALGGRSTEDLPTLKFKAYAVQKANVKTAADAWNKIQEDLGN